MGMSKLGEFAERRATAVSCITESYDARNRFEW